jgi:hypothetical protein
VLLDGLDEFGRGRRAGSEEREKEKRREGKSGRDPYSLQSYDLMNFSNSQFEDRQSWNDLSFTDRTDMIDPPCLPLAACSFLIFKSVHCTGFVPSNDAFSSLAPFLLDHGFEVHLCAFRHRGFQKTKRERRQSIPQVAMYGLLTNVAGRHRARRKDAC